MNTTARVSVHDNGPGIPPEHQGRIFDKFHQAGTNKAKLGTGLGLAFSKLAVEAHGGRIGVEVARVDAPIATGRNNSRST